VKWQYRSLSQTELEKAPATITGQVRSGLAVGASHGPLACDV
jgi:hypothetical protein